MQRYSGELIIKANYEEPIDLSVTTYVFKFQIEERAPLF
jgi:hypothetical protein